jgi:hypothetical protein
MRGSPARLSAVVALGDEDASSVHVDLPKLEPGALVVQPVEGVGARVTVSVPRLTPPGAYEGTVRVGGHERPLVIEVEPRVSLGVDPRRLYFQAAAGAAVEADVTVTNLGNVPLELPREDSFTLFQSGGLSRALGRAFGSTPAKGERRLDDFVDAAAEAVGGVVALMLDGAGKLAPGEARPIHLGLTLPDGLHPGRIYWGTWALYHVNYVVRVEVTGSAPTPAPPRARKGAR